MKITLKNGTVIETENPAEIVGIVKLLSQGREPEVSFAPPGLPSYIKTGRRRKPRYRRGKRCQKCGGKVEKHRKQYCSVCARERTLERNRDRMAKIKAGTWSYPGSPGKGKQKRCELCRAKPVFGKRRFCNDCRAIKNRESVKRFYLRKTRR